MKLRARILLGGFGLALAALSPACSREPLPGETEEVFATESEVPVVVKATAQRICERLGSGSTGKWAWDRESQDWEVELLGLTRVAELDILPDGRFSELELVYRLAEVEATLPDVAATIHERCRDDSRVFVELSLRNEAHLDPLPDLKSAWTRDGVVMEFQCSNGRDFELDARHMVLEHRVDDIEGALQDE